MSSIILQKNVDHLTERLKKNKTKLPQLPDNPDLATLDHLAAIFKIPTWILLNSFTLLANQRNPIGIVNAVSIMQSYSREQPEKKVKDGHTPRVEK
jgi:hypothetical protein